NVIEMGKGIYGTQAAAKAYFGKDAQQLTRKEASLIAACLPNPVRYTVKPVSKFVAFKSGWILAQMRAVEGNKEVQAIIQKKAVKKSSKG
ncbi:MAG TPA: transglycosylase domain-containing protein, partial [Flavisolibacter sp.]|nr:transglycosylase domain-containing protein [Flavisolibacter sp.]